MDNPEKLSTQGSQNEEKHNTCVLHDYTQTYTKTLKQSSLSCDI